MENLDPRGRSPLSAQDIGQLYIARTLPEPSLRSPSGGGAAPLAGATWIMRAPIRQERLAPSYVAISKIGALREVTVDDREVRIGACVTHAELAGYLASLPECRALASAAANAANPAVRQVATDRRKSLRLRIRRLRSRACADMPRRRDRFASAGRDREWP